MKAFTLSLILFVSFMNLKAQNQCTAKPYKNHLQINNINGPVKVLTENLWRHKDTATRELEYAMVYSYNTFGNLIGQVQYRKDSSIAAVYRYTYDSTQRISTYTHHWPENEAAISTCNCRYNTAGYAVSELTTMYSGTRIIGETRLNYDSKGRLVKKMTVRPTMQDSAIRLMKYDTLGHLASEVFTGNMGGHRTDRNKASYTYDSAGRVKEVKTVYKDDITWTSFAYDQYGNTILEQHYEGKEKKPGSVETSIYKYDSRNNWIKKTIRYTGSDGYVTNRSVERLIEYY